MELHQHRREDGVSHRQQSEHCDCSYRDHHVAGACGLPDAGEQEACGRPSGLPIADVGREGVYSRTSASGLSVHSLRSSSVFQRLAVLSYISPNILILRFRGFQFHNTWRYQFASNDDIVSLYHILDDMRVSIAAFPKLCNHL
jgi:hypothetical protein